MPCKQTAAASLRIKGLIVISIFFKQIFSNFPTAETRIQSSFQKYAGPQTSRAGEKQIYVEPLLCLMILYSVACSLLYILSQFGLNTKTGLTAV